MNENGSLNKKHEVHTKEDSKFTVHPDLIYQTIHSQAGSLEKALLEGFQNSVDAKATKFSITLDAFGFVLEDDGVGFKSKKEIKEWFGRFGTPHEEGDAVFGRFRIGRGQIFSYAETVWEAGKFKMEVDIKNRGLEYGLIQHKKVIFDGCKISGVLYEDLEGAHYNLNRVINSLKEMVAFAPIRVILNGDCISVVPSEASWDFEDEYAYYKFDNSGSIKVYNLGVFVREYSGSYFGVGGIVVSKRHFELNQARSDILQHKCSLWEFISTRLAEEGLKRAKDKKRLTDDERRSILERLFNGDLEYSDVQDMALVVLAGGKKIRISHLFRDYSHFTMEPPGGSRLSDGIQQRELACVLSQKNIFTHRLLEDVSFVRWLIELLTGALSDLECELEFGGVDGNELYNLRQSVRTISFIRDKQYRFTDFQVLADGLDEQTIEHWNSIDLDPKKKAALSAIKAGNDEYTWRNKRRILHGESDVCSAWTNGESWIAFDVDTLKLMDKGFTGAFELTALLIHEYSHDSSDRDSHEHDFGFYESFHRSILDESRVGKVAWVMINKYIKEIVKAGLKPPANFANYGKQLLRKNEKGGVVPLHTNGDLLEKLDFLSGVSIKAKGNKDKRIHDLIEKLVDENMPVEDVIFYKRKHHDYVDIKCSKCNEIIRWVNPKVKKIVCASRECGHAFWIGKVETKGYLNE